MTPRRQPRLPRAPGCDVCGIVYAASRELFAEVDDRWYCRDCYAAAGRPSARQVPTLQAVHEAELQTRERMTARGGKDRYLVRSGKA